MSGKNVAASVRQRLLKVEAMVKLGLTNSRMKDFYDLVIMARTFPFTGPVLRDAIAATFTRRWTAIPSASPVALTEAFASDETKQKQWQAFCKRSGVAEKVGDLNGIVAELAAFLCQPLAAAAAGREFPLSWQAGAPWEMPS